MSCLGMRLLAVSVRAAKRSDDGFVAGASRGFCRKRPLPMRGADARCGFSLCGFFSEAIRFSVFCRSPFAAGRIPVESGHAGRSSCGAGERIFSFPVPNDRGAGWAWAGEAIAARCRAGRRFRGRDVLSPDMGGAGKRRPFRAFGRGGIGIGREGKLTTANRADKGFLGVDLDSTVCNRLPEGFTVHFVPGSCRGGILKNGFRALPKTAGFVRKTGGEAFLRRGAAASRSGRGEKDRFCCGRTAGRAGYAETKCVLRDDGRTEIYVVRRGKKMRLPGLETTGLWPGAVCLSSERRGGRSPAKDKHRKKSCRRTKFIGIRRLYSDGQLAFRSFERRMQALARQGRSRIRAVTTEDCGAVRS